MTKASVLGCEPMQKRMMEGDTTDDDSGPVGGGGKKTVFTCPCSAHIYVL